ncbi:MAG: translation initiation factor IF-2, partial [Planctomycetaceae bacterium]
MAEVTVSELAKTVGASVERLLMQMKEAGLSHTSEGASVSDDEKQTLLAYLKGLHGDSSREPKKIVLQRKTLSTLRSGNRKTVNIEVRKKRTYIKRSDEEIQAQVDAEAQEQVLVEEVAAVVVPEPIVVPEPEVVAEVIPEPVVEVIPEPIPEPTPEPTPEPVADAPKVYADPELQRLAAIGARRKAAAEAKAKVEAEALFKVEEAARLAAEAASAAKAAEAKKVGK